MVNFNILPNPKVIAFAIDAHQKVNHLYNGKPYSLHLAMVYHYALKHISCIPEPHQSDVLNACWLHDTIEDCRLSYNDIVKFVGSNVADIVYALTNEKGKNRSERANDKYYQGILDVPYAKYVKLCDRLANIHYSLHTGSGMFSMYIRENDDFLSSLFPKDLDGDYGDYIDIVMDIKSFVK